MHSVEKRPSEPFRLAVIAICEWLTVLPATVLLAAAALRMLQPRQYEPARTSWILFEWTMMHVSGLGAAILFIGMPAVVVITGCTTLLRIWLKDAGLRQDGAMTVAILRRNLAGGLLTVAVLLAGAILAAVAVHIVTD